MKYLDIDKLRSLTTEAFWQQDPYPWISQQGLITEAGYQELLDTLPALSLFEEKFAYERRAGQKPHDRYSLEYTPDTAVSPAWKTFIDELCSDDYRREIARLFGAKRIEFRFHWHYTPNGCSVSPHCDSRREHGSHLFYFNAEKDWNPEWGGDTLILDDGGRLDYNSAPDLSAFDRILSSPATGNYAALIKRTDHAWHAVREIQCPEDKLRKVFIVVVNPDNLFWKVRDRVIGKKIQRF